jgi:two-component system, cell cycle response regulator DivK
MPQITDPSTPQRTSPNSAAAPAFVLVIEDNAGNFMLIARMLASLNLQCEWKTSGYEVIEFMEALPKIDLILLDIRLPYEDGYGALRKIRQNERFHKLPIIAVTAVSGVDQMNQAKLAGFDGFIGKPLDPDKFPAQITNILNGVPVWDCS